MEHALTVLMVLTCSCLVLLSPATVAEQRTVLSATEAIDLVMQKVKAGSLYDSSTNRGCLSFLVEENSPIYFNIAIREKHGGKCP